jgi:hypothetical protein
MSPDGKRWSFSVKKKQRFNSLRCGPKIRSEGSYWFVAGVFILYDHVWPDEAGRQYNIPYVITIS